MSLPAVIPGRTTVDPLQAGQDPPKTPNNNQLTAAQGPATTVDTPDKDPNYKGLPTDETTVNSTMGTNSNGPTQTEFDNYVKSSIKKVLPSDTDLYENPVTPTAVNANSENTSADAKVGGSTATKAQRPKHSKRLSKRKRTKSTPRKSKKPKRVSKKSHKKRRTAKKT